MDAAWRVLGTGDFDGDESSDILWQHSGGQVVIWFVVGGRLEGESGPKHPTGEFQAIGDFDGNLRSDILWRHDDGLLHIGFNGVEFFGSDHPTYQNRPPSYGRPRAPWRPRGLDDVVAGVRDVSDGGRNDVPGDLSWRVEGAGDFDHDGRDDILWRHADGQVGIWRIDGERFRGDLYPGRPDNRWQIEGLLRE